jgi:hypothetical protein
VIHRLDETITLAQRANTTQQCEQTRRICECRTPARDVLATCDPGCGRGLGDKKMVTRI